jgi:hypothetical protein
MPQTKWIFSGVVLLIVVVWYTTPLRSPYESQLVGDYRITLTWGSASLHLSADKTFSEEVHSNNGAIHKIQGTWSLRPGWQSGLLLKPYWDFDRDNEGEQTDDMDLPVESWGFTDIRIELGDPDSGTLFRKQ